MSRFKENDIVHANSYMTYIITHVYGNEVYDCKIYTENGSRVPNEYKYNKAFLGQNFKLLKIKSKEELVLDKIKYLNERKTLDKSRIVPPQGIYRGRGKVSEVPPANQARTPRVEGFVSTIGFTAEEIERALAALARDYRTNMARIYTTGPNEINTV